MKQTNLKSFLSIESPQQSESDSEYFPSPKKSDLKLPEMWTRVKSRNQPVNQRITVFDIEKDLNTDRVLKQVRKGATTFQGSILFDPDEWKGKDQELKLDQHRLSHE